MPDNLQISHDFSTTFEFSRMLPPKLPPLLTSQEVGHDQVSRPQLRPPPFSPPTSPAKPCRTRASNGPHVPLTPTKAPERLNIDPTSPCAVLPRDLSSHTSQSPPRKKTSTTPTRPPPTSKVLLVDENHHRGEGDKKPVGPTRPYKPPVKRASLFLQQDGMSDQPLGALANGRLEAHRRRSEVPPPSSAPPSSHTFLHKQVTTSIVPTLTSRVIGPSVSARASNPRLVERGARLSTLAPLKGSAPKRLSLVTPSSSSAKASGLGLGLPSTARTKSKPSTAAPARGSPVVKKDRSSISTAMTSGSPARRIVGVTLLRPPATSGGLKKPNSTIQISRLRSPNEPGKPLSATKSSTSSSELDRLGKLRANERGRPPLDRGSSTDTRNHAVSSLPRSSSTEFGRARPSSTIVPSTPTMGLGRRSSLIKPSSSAAEFPRPSLMMRPSISSKELARPSSEVSHPPVATSMNQMRPSLSSQELWKHTNEFGARIGPGGIPLPSSSSSMSGGGRFGRC